MAVGFSAISGTTYPAWLSAFQASLGHLILHGCELFGHLWNKIGLLKHLWGILSCMAVAWL